MAKGNGEEAEVGEEHYRRRRRRRGERARFGEMGRAPTFPKGVTRHTITSSKQVGVGSFCHVCRLLYFYPSLLAGTTSSRYHNAKVDTGDDDVNGLELLQRFNWQVSRAGVMEEIKRWWRRGTSASTRRGRQRGGIAAGVLDQYICFVDSCV
jgi:hypothetical protein